MLEFLDVVRGLNFMGVKNFTAYLRAVLLDFLKKREIELVMLD